MKYLFLSIIFLFSIDAKCQDISKIDILEKRKLEIETKISLLKDSLSDIVLSIASIKLENVIEVVKQGGINTYCIDLAKLKDQPNPLGTQILVVKTRRQISVLDYIDGYFGVKVDTIFGYMNELWVEKDSSIINFVKLKNLERQRQMDLASEKERVKTKGEADELEKVFILKYGKTTYERLRKGEYWLGMTDDMALISLGMPAKQNRTIGRWGIHEQWVYSVHDRLYLYFENGILKSYQD